MKQNLEYYMTENTNKKPRKIVGKLIFSDLQTLMPSDMFSSWSIVDLIGMTFFLKPITKP